MPWLYAGEGCRERRSASVPQTAALAYALRAADERLELITAAVLAVMLTAQVRGGTTGGSARSTD